MSSTYELLVNTRSRKGRESLDLIKAACKQGNLNITKIHRIKDPSRLPAVLRGIKSRKPDVLIVGSGDGTVSEAVDYLARTNICLAFIPLGTTNNFARSLGIPLDITAAVKHIKRGKEYRIDLGQAKSDYFANVAGVGLSAQVAGAVTSRDKKRYGRLAYAITGLKTLIHHKPFMVEISDKDKELQLNFKTHQIIIANGRFHAGKQIAKGAKLDSRELVIFKLGGSSKLSFLWHMFDYYYGKRRSVMHSSYLIAKNVTVRTSTPQPVELDGEVKFNTPIPVKVHPLALKVIR